MWLVQLPQNTYGLHRQRRLLTINFLEHAIHVLQVVMIQEPHGVVPVILIKWH